MEIPNCSIPIEHLSPPPPNRPPTRDPYDRVHAGHPHGQYCDKVSCSKQRGQQTRTCSESVSPLPMTFGSRTRKSINIVRRLVRYRCPFRTVMWTTDKNMLRKRVSSHYNLRQQDKEVSDSVNSRARPKKTITARHPVTPGLNDTG